jgi:hypothetical protein
MPTLQPYEEWVIHYILKMVKIYITQKNLRYRIPNANIGIKQQEIMRKKEWEVILLLKDHQMITSIQNQLANPN